MSRIYKTSDMREIEVAEADRPKPFVLCPLCEDRLSLDPASILAATRCKCGRTYVRRATIEVTPGSKPAVKNGHIGDVADPFKPDRLRAMTDTEAIQAALTLEMRSVSEGLARSAAILQEPLYLCVDPAALREEAAHTKTAHSSTGFTGETPLAACARLFLYAYGKSLEKTNEGKHE